MSNIKVILDKSNLDSIADAVRNQSGDTENYSIDTLVSKTIDSINNPLNDSIKAKELFLGSITNVFVTFPSKSTNDNIFWFATIIFSDDLAKKVYISSYISSVIFS